VDWHDAAMATAESRQLGLVGAAGLLLFLIGSFVPGVAPPVDAPTGDWSLYLTENRAVILLGAVMTVTAVPLMLAVVAAATSTRRTPSGAYALAAWVFAFGFIVLAEGLMAAVAWQGPDTLDESTLRFAVDAAHLALWGLSAGPAAVAVVVTTVVARRDGLAPRWLMALAAIKVLTSVVELAGVGVTHGWNAGGYAAFSSGVALAAWLAGLIWVTLRHDPATRA